MKHFCHECIRRQAETLIGLSQYSLNCMSTDGCEAGFGHDSLQAVLSTETLRALDKLETSAVLRMAELPGLEYCPFCDFAAECPPPEVDREFRCLNSDCAIVSCRFCQLEGHAPKTCQENASTKGYLVRKEIEEAMSAAMIRRCNKCE